MAQGVLVVRKEPGMTSFGVVARLRRIFEQKKIGHTGTLDPDAEGVLLVCLGRATHLVDHLSTGTKAYEAVLLLGRKTDTQDTTGEILEERPVNVREDEVRDAVLSFEGPQMQLPPMFSALKVDGKKLVNLARRGIEVERTPREVTFSNIEILKIDLPRVTFRVTCTRGAYIRTLCEDIGEKLGCLGCMEHLTRIRVGEFSIEEARTLDEIAALHEAGTPEKEYILPIDYFYRAYPAYLVSGETEITAKHGGRFPKREAKPFAGEPYAELREKEKTGEAAVGPGGKDDKIFKPAGGPLVVPEEKKIRLYGEEVGFIGTFYKDRGLYRQFQMYM